MQLIQTVVRLGMYTGNVRTYNSVKACKGTMLFLPLPLNKTLDTLEEVKHSHTANDLPDPELYVIVNGKPTKARVVWQSLVNIDDVKAAVSKLREINWLYQNVDESSVDDAVKKVIEVVNSANSKVLEKATSEHIASFQSYTIRNLESQLSVQSDIDQFVAKSVKEDPISNTWMSFAFRVSFRLVHLGSTIPNSPNSDSVSTSSPGCSTRMTAFERMLNMSSTSCGKRKCIKCQLGCTTS